MTSLVDRLSVLFCVITLSALRKPVLGILWHPQTDMQKAGDVWIFSHRNQTLSIINGPPSFIYQKKKKMICTTFPFLFDNIPISF